MWIEVMRVAKNGFRACMYIGRELIATTPYPESFQEATKRAFKWEKETHILFRNHKNPRAETA